MFMRNLAAGRSAAECVKQWSGGSAVPALVARMQEVPPPQHILVHILYCLSNFASSGQHASSISITTIIIDTNNNHINTNSNDDDSNDGYNYNYDNTHK